jgi:hypothetical protein
LPGWQQVYEQYGSDDFEIVSVAMEHTGGDAARPFVEHAGATFPTVIDEHGVTVSALEFRLVPNGVLVDTDGTIRYAKFGGFRVENDEDREAVERFARGEDPGPGPDVADPYTLSAVERELIETKLRLGRMLDSAGRREDAIREWESALHRDPENLVIRKQIWLARYPEKFHPVIDKSWQKTQLEQERAAEIAAGICGPDGCPIPSQSA